MIWGWSVRRIRGVKVDLVWSTVQPNQPHIRRRVRAFMNLVCFVWSEAVPLAIIVVTATVVLFVCWLSTRATSIRLLPNNIKSIKVSYITPLHTPIYQSVFLE